MRVGRITGLLLALALVAGGGNAQLCHPNCNVAIQCNTYGTNMNGPECGAATSAAIGCLQMMAMQKGKPEWGAIANQLQISFQAGRLRSYTCPSDSFGFTEANCIDTGPPVRKYWCPGVTTNCICIHSGLLNEECRYLPAANDCEGAKAILAAALAHEMCHALTNSGSGVLTDGDNWEVEDLCEFYCREVECAQLEKDILECSQMTQAVVDRINLICGFICQNQRDKERHCNV